MDNKIRVLIADDHNIFRSGVRQLLESKADIIIVGEAKDGNEVLRLAEVHQPDVILMDIAMPGMDGMEATRNLKSRWPDTAILVLTMHQHDEYLFEMLKAGASGYILKGDGISDLLNAIKIVHQGKVYLNPDMAQRLVQDFLNRTGAVEDSKPMLTQREKEILGFLAEGYSNSEIGQKLVISPSTVHSHRSNIMKKLNLSTRHELIQYAREQGLLRDF